MPRQESLRLVVDTNILISSLISVGMMEVMRRIVDGHTLLHSEEQMLEFSKVMARPKLKGRILPDHMDELFQGMAIQGEMVRIPTIKEVCRDPDDDHLLALCKAGGADYLVTGDKGLLVLKRYLKTRIITAAQFVELTS